MNNTISNILTHIYYAYIHTEMAYAFQIFYKLGSGSKLQKI